MSAATAILPVHHPLTQRYGSAYWDCSLTRLEKWILPLCIVISMALQIKAVLYSSLAVPFIGLMAVLCWLTPTTGFFYIACAQFLPFPEGSSLNPAQIGVVTWLVGTFVQHRKMDLSGLGMLWPVLPWLLWFWLITGEAIYHPNSEYFKAVIYSVIACQQVNSAKGRHLKCLLGMCLGTLMATTAFWAFQMGLGVDLSTWGGERSGFARLGGVRADAVMIWPPLLMGCFGILGLTLSAMVSNRYPEQIKKAETSDLGCLLYLRTALGGHHDPRGLRRLRPHVHVCDRRLRQPQTPQDHQQPEQPGGAHCHFHDRRHRHHVFRQSFSRPRAASMRCLITTSAHPANTERPPRAAMYGNIP
jgi:hypothetical protein